jgi:hypothetical protein
VNADLRTPLVPMHRVRGTPSSKHQDGMARICLAVVIRFRRIWQLLMIRIVGISTNCLGDATNFGALMHA